MYQLIIKQHNGTIPVKEERWELQMHQGRWEMPLVHFPCHIRCDWQEIEDGGRFDVSMEALADLEGPVSMSWQYSHEEWKGTEYVFMPGAVYDGNRMDCKRLPYPPYHVGKCGEKWQEVITDIPHLSKHGKESGIQFLSGDMSTPAMGYFDPTGQAGVLILSKHKEAGCYTGFTVKEEGKHINFSVSCPGVREKKKYFFGELPGGEGFYPTCDYPSDDEGIILKAGQKLCLTVLCKRFTVGNLSAFLGQFHKIREVLEQGEDYCSVPFSKAFETIKEKYIHMNFEEEGYLRVGAENTSIPSFWQAGWVGGGMNTYPLLMEDGGVAHWQALSTLSFIVKHLQKKNGWYLPMYAKGKSYGDAFSEDGDSVLLVRKDGDLLYFLLKQMFYLQQQNIPVEGLSDSVRAQADALIRFVKKNGEVGQFLDMDREILLEGGTASGAIVPAALSLAYEYYGEEAYLETAETLGMQYKERCLKRGVLNGGPGEICQAPDSESAFALLESYVQLYETTGKEVWLESAKEAFDLAITWVMSYDFQFPEGSMAQRMGVHTAGTVFANAQNKHSAPGICTLSGNSMLKLYRATGEKRYLEWMRRISHALTQFVSLKDRQIDTLAGKALPPGFINERVQTSDWEGKHTVGEFLYGSNWPETSMLLTYVEIPGVYIDLDRDISVCSDHVVAAVVEKEKGQIVLSLKNTTPYDAQVTVLAEHGKSGNKLGHLYYGRMEKILVPAGKENVAVITVQDSGTASA